MKESQNIIRRIGGQGTQRWALVGKSFHKAFLLSSAGDWFDIIHFLPYMKTLIWIFSCVVNWIPLVLEFLLFSCWIHIIPAPKVCDPSCPTFIALLILVLQSCGWLFFHLVLYIFNIMVILMGGSSWFYSLTLITEYRRTYKELKSQIIKLWVKRKKNRENFKTHKISRSRYRSPKH